VVPDAKHIRTLREKRGWTQADLALASGTTERTIQRMEAGRNVSLDSLKLVASALDLDFSQLLPAEEPPAPVGPQDAVFKQRYAIRQQLYETISKLRQFWEDHVPGARLTDADGKWFEKWLRTYTTEELLSAMDECIRQYVELLPNGLCRTESAEFAFTKIPAVCYVSRSDPNHRELYFIRASVRKRVHHFDDREAISLLKAAFAAGTTVEKLRAFAAAANTWDEFTHGLEILTEAPNAELQVMRRRFRPPSPEVVRALENGNTTFQETVAIVAATKQLAADPKDVAAEVLRKAAAFGEIVLTINYERCIYYFGHCRTGSGRMFGICEPWAARELADAIRDGFQFCDREDTA
jgi:transcriptional regulator with XRE-family HTH domain